MKPTNKILLTIIFMAVMQPAFSQFYGAGIQLSRIMGGPLIRNFGIHGTAEYMIDEKMGITGSIGFFLPHKTNSTLTLYARDNFTTPRSIDLACVDKTSGFQINVMGKRYFGNEYEGEGIGFYGLAGIGISSFAVNTKIPDYDESTYGAFERSEYEHESATGFTIGLGLGLDFQTESGSFYFEPTLNLPASTANGSEIEVTIPTTIQFNLGYRLLLY